MSLCDFCEHKNICEIDTQWSHTDTNPCSCFVADANYYGASTADLRERIVHELSGKSQTAKKDGGKPHPSYVTLKERSKTPFMTSDTFESICEEQMDICRGVLFNKAKEYAQNDDRLHNFRSAAGMTGDSMQSALSGMMLKHTISVYDMCRSRDTYPLDLWTEKITDHINYLLLLKAVIVEEAGNP